MLYVGIRGAEPPGWAAAEIDVCGIALQDGQAQPQTWGALRLVAARQIVQQVQRSCAHAWWGALRGPRGGRQRAEGCG